ncbi:hypothetical protein [Bacillus paramycoides]|uniref:hypothetical protein n=1 Tax=Bacillus paramycoides TaxID=2026194 RepID=UPI002E2496A8|nr:hypothetical protein [Bacillus paramycoides]MED1464830.1 hypothetical protein [Bacillus paramycoides]MED1493357.1 hypothetical protein [Bacillus paramycoides]
MENVINMKAKTQEVSETQEIIEQLFREAHNLGVYPRENCDEILLVGEIDRTVYLLQYYNGGCAIITAEADPEGNFTVSLPDEPAYKSNLNDYVFPMQPLYYEKFYNSLFVPASPTQEIEE